MLSLVAMAALPMAGLADALVPEVGEGKWQTETGDEVGLDDHGLLVSIGGSTITKTFTLVPGTYSVNAETCDHAVIEVEANGQTYRKGVSGVSFTLEEAGAVTVKLSADTYGTKFTVGGLTLTLYYDFNAAHATLRDMLNGAYSKLSNGEEADPWEKELNEDYIGQNGLLQQVFSIQDGTDDAYKVYMEQELYRGVENSKIYEAIQKYVLEVDDCVANKKAYKEFKEEAEVWQETNLVALKNTLDNAVDQKTKDFYQGEVDALNTEVTDFLTELQTKYEAREAVKYTTEVKGEWAEKMPEKISELQAKIQAFDKVMQAVTEATDEKEGYNAKVAELIKDINAKGRYKEILADVKETLAEDYKPVYEVEQFIKNKDNDPRDHKAANIKKVTDAKDKMQADYDLYKERLDHYTAAYADLDDFQKRLNTVTKGMEDIKNTEYNDEISDIQKLLDAIDKKFQQGMEDNMDLPDWSESEDKREVESRLSNLKTETQATLDNYNAWGDLKAKIKTLRDNLTEANTNVATYVSEDNAYTATKYWTVSEGIKTTIDALENDVKDAYDDGKAVDFKNNSVEQQRFTAIQTKIDDFDRTAKAAFDDYVTVQNKLKEWQIALGTVQGFVTNRDVIMSDGTTTYGEALDEAAQAIIDLQTNLQTALGLKDYDHADEMSGLAATQKPAVLDKTQADFETDLQNYSADRALKDAIKLAGTVSNLKDEVEGKRDKKEDEFKEIPATELGLRFNTIEQQLKDYATTLSGMQIVGATSITKDNAIAVQKELSEQMRTLYNIQKGIEAINLEQIKADVKKNNDTYNQLSGNFSTLEEEIRKINDFTATSGGFAPDSYNRDPNRTDEFEGIKNDLQSKWGNLTDGLYKAYSNETVVADGWETKYENFKKEVEDKVDEAKASTNNWNAYNDLLETIEKTFRPKREDGTGQGDLIDEEEQEITAVATPVNAGQEYFLNLLKGYRTQLETLESTVKQAYVDRDCDTKETEFNAAIKGLKESIEGLRKLAEDNEKNHNSLLEKEAETLKRWNEVYDQLSGEDQSSKIMEWLDQLREIKTEFNATVGDVEVKFGEGVYSKDEAKEAYVKTFDDYVERINKIQGNWKDPSGYLAAIIADNAARHKAFQYALQDAIETFNRAVLSLAKFQNITDEELQVEFDKVIKANQTDEEELYRYSELFRNLKEEEQDAYDEVVAKTSPSPEEGITGTPVTFDLEEKFRDTAKGYAARITKIYNDTTDDLNATSKLLLGDALTVAEKAVKDAENAIANYHVEVANAFYDEKQYIQTGKNWLSDNPELENRELAVKLANGFLAKVRGIGDSVLDECEDLAQQEYDKLYEVLKAYDDDARQKLDTYKVPEDDDIDYKQLYEDDYNQYISGDGGFIAIGTDAKAQNCMFSDDGLKAAMYQYDLFMQKNRFITFWNQVQNKVESDRAYDKLMGEQGVVNIVQGIIDAARTYANAYFITNPDIETAQGTLNSIVADIEAAKAQGTVHSTGIPHSTDFETRLQNCKDTAEGLNYITNILENEELNSQIEHLRYEYNQFVATVEVDAEKQAAYETTIKGYQDELDNIYVNYLINNIDEDKAQADFIALEGKIAASRTEITNLFNDKLIPTLYGELRQLATDVKNLCNANSQNLEENCHEPVQKLFADKLEHVAEEATMAAGKIETYMEAGTLLFYSERLNNTLEQLKNSLTTMAEEIEKAEAPYDVNDAACERLQTELDGYVARYNALKEKLQNYKHCNYDGFLSDTRFTDKSKQDQERLDKAQKEIATDPNVMLSEDATLLYEHYEALLLDLDRTYSYNEAAWRVQDVYDKLAEANEAKKELEGYRYINTNEVDDAYRSIDKAYNNMLYFNEDSHGTVDGGGFISADIDGNKFYNEWGVEVSKYISWAAYVSDCVPAVFERCEKLLGKVKEYSDLIMKSRYLIGDVNEDEEVLVDDYTTILRHTLGAARITEARLLAAADANFDGAVNIGDLTAVARIITGTDDVQPVAAPSRVRSIIAPSADALTVRFEGEGVHQRIAISVDASRLYAGAQMDIRLPEGITLSAATAGAGAEGFAVHTNALENGMHRVVLTSLEGLTFAENSDALLWLDVQVDHNYNGEGVEISNILFSDTMAHVYSLQAPAGEATGLGTVSMTEEVKEKIYNVGGILMDGLKRGVNIIRGNDGSGKKVIVK